MYAQLLARVSKHWRGRIQNRGARKPTRPPGLLYSVDEIPPRAVLVVAALQHVALISNSLVYPIILGREAHLSSESLVDFVSLSMLALGISTFLLCARTRFIGCGYLCPAAYTQIYLGPSLFAVQTGGLPLVFGMTLLAGILQLAMAPVLQRARALLPPEIAGLVIAVVGLSIAVLGARYSLGVTTESELQPTQLTIAAVSLITMVVLNVWTQGYARMFCVLVGIAVGYVATAALGVLDFPAAVPSDALYFLRFPRVHFFDWGFDVTLLAPFAVVAVAGALHLMGNISTAQRVNDADWVRPNFGSLSSGLAGNGLASIVCSLIGSLGVNSYSSSIGLSTATGITSRSLAPVISIAFVLLAFMPPAAALLATIPTPVIGAALFFTAAFVFTSGLQMITARLLDARKIIVIGFSFSAAMIADIYHETLTQVPVLVRPVFDNALVLGTICAVFLNLIMRIGVRKRVSIRVAAGDVRWEAVERFLSEQGSHWAARRDVVNRAIFAVLQLLDVLEDVRSEIVIEASFDEFNLDIRVSYEGDVLEFPEQRPSNEQILEEDGARLLAGFMLRRNADRVRADAKDGRASVLFHFDH
jgi:NCS2 family nucleobase:cation symporter-2